MKLSEITLPIVKEYLRQDCDEDDQLIEAIIDGAKAYVVNYTGRTIEALENQEDVVIAVLLLVAEFYDNRTITVNDRLNLRVNMMLESLLDRHSVNLL